ncbi:MAG: amidohydrolase [Candidatus Desulforudis sp.]|nr:amidohydrolase [Desulforudis sp.]
MRLLIENAYVIPVAGDQFQGDIAVGDGRIIHLGPAGSVPEAFTPDETLDATGMAATPGLVNSHTHAAMTLFRGYADDLPLMEWLGEKIWPVEAVLTGEDIYRGSLLAGLEMLKSGTTTFADQYFEMDQVARAVEEIGLRASLCRGLIGIAPHADQALAESRDFIRNWHGAANGRITAMLGPHAPYTCPPSYLEKVLAAADELGVGLHIHLSETRTEIEQIQTEYGCSPIELMEKVNLFERPVLAAHCVHLSEADMEILAEKRVGVAHNPQSNMKLGSGIAPVARMLAAGITVGIGTDGAASNNDLNMVEEMRTAALLQKVGLENPTVLPAGQVLEMATVGGAKALGLAEQIGTLEVGKRADIVLWNLNQAHLCPLHNVQAHLVYSAGRADADTVIVDGRILMRGRRVLTVDEETILREAGCSARALVTRASSA